MNVAETPLRNTAPGQGTSPSLLCPGCGYDLRAATEDRCSECGLVIDRAQLGRSSFPWAHRAGLGRLRAFVKTVRLVTLDTRLLRQEASKTQSPRDAAVFRRCVAATLVISFAAVVIMALAADVLREVAITNTSSALATGSTDAGLEEDFMIPWSAGITQRPALFVYAAALAFYFASATRPIFRTRGLDKNSANSIEAISGYVIAPLVFLVPAMVGYGALYWMGEHEDYDFDSPPLVVIVWVIGVCSFLLFAMAVGGTVFRTGQWRARTTDAKYSTGLIAMGELLFRWLIGSYILLAVFPWCVGFVWIVIDSFRR